MSDINQITIIGNLTRDPELRHTQNGTPVVEFTIASNRIWKNSKNEEIKEKKTTFINCTAWKGAAETIAKYVKVGHRFGVTGYLDQDNWDDKDTGAKRTKHFITVEKFQFLQMKETTPGSEADFDGDTVPF